MKADIKTERWNESHQEQVRRIFQRYRGERSELIPILQDVQEALGYLPREAMAAVAAFLNAAESAVYGVATFYAQFNFVPQGRHKVKVCQGTACHVRGSGAIVQAVSQALGIKPGETSKDFEFSVETVACFGSCALAPVMVVDGKVYGNVTPKKAKAMMEALK